MKQCVLVLCVAVTALPGFSDQLARQRDYSSTGFEGGRIRSE